VKIHIKSQEQGVAKMYLEGDLWILHLLEKSLTPLSGNIQHHPCKCVQETQTKKLDKRVFFFRLTSLLEVIHRAQNIQSAAFFQGSTYIHCLVSAHFAYIDH